LDDELAAAGFDERRFPDGRVLRICSRSAEATISQIGRELGITRQGASKIVASLRDRRYVTVKASATDGREKVVELTPRAIEYLAARRKAAREIERQLRTEIGADGFDSLYLLLEALGGDEQPRMSDYLRKATDFDTLR
jgi:DNA-binding MarR family transcriptional regulator